LNANLIYVHLGVNSSPTLLNYSSLVAKDYSNIKCFLISDNPKSWKGFPGEVIDAKSYLRNLYPWIWRMKHYEKFSVAGGYWVNTLSRLFTFELARPFVNPDELVVHVESDNLVFPVPRFIHTLKTSLKKTSICAVENERGIASVVVAPNIENLISSFCQLKEVAFTSKRWLTDMELLGEGLRSGLLASLTALPLFGGDGKEMIVFDGFEYGPYLFGLDPIHQGGMSQGGFESPTFRTNGLRGVWGMGKAIESKSDVLRLQNPGETFYLFNLHVHAKLHFDSLRNESPIWRLTIDAANRIQDFPRFENSVVSSFHERNGTLMARLIRFMKSRL